MKSWTMRPDVSNSLILYVLEVERSLLIEGSFSRSVFKNMGCCHYSRQERAFTTGPSHRAAQTRVFLSPKVEPSKQQCLTLNENLPSKR